MLRVVPSGSARRTAFLSASGIARRELALTRSARIEHRGRNQARSNAKKPF